MQPAGAEILRRFQQRAIQLLNAGVERHHHKRQQNVDQADNHRRRGVHDAQRRFNNPQPQQKLVEVAPGAKKDFQPVDADQRVGPERDDQQKQQQRTDLFRQPGEKPGKGVAEQQAGERRHQRHIQRVQQHRVIERVQQARIVIQRKDQFDEVRVVAGQKAGADNHQVGQENKQHQPADDGGNHHALEFTGVLH